MKKKGNKTFLLGLCTFGSLFRGYSDKCSSSESPTALAGGKCQWPLCGSPETSGYYVGQAMDGEIQKL